MVMSLHQVLLCLLVLLLGPVASLSVIAAEPPAHRYNLDTIIEQALAKNPSVSLAEGHIDYSRGQQVAAGAYPNPTVYGECRIRRDTRCRAGGYPGVACSPIADRIQHDRRTTV